MGLLLTMGGSWPWGGATHHGRFLNMMARLSWVSFSLLIASTAGRFLGHGGVTHHGRFLTMMGVATHHGRFPTMRGATQNGRFLTMRGATHHGRFLTMWECYSPWKVPDHDGWTELGFLQFADRLHCVPERRFRPTVIYNTQPCKLTHVPCWNTPSIH